MRATMGHPGTMKVCPEHVAADGRTMVYIEEADEFHALLLWVTPANAAQWIEALTPIAEATP